MNVFFADKCPKCAAHYLQSSKLQRKMIVENAQGVLKLFNIDTPVKPMSMNHPSQIWLFEGYNNWVWVLNQGITLCSSFNGNVIQNQKKSNHKYTEVYKFYASISTKIKPLYDQLHLTLPFLAFDKSLPENAKLKENFGIAQKIKSRYNNKVYEFYRAKSFSDVVLAYRKYLSLKNYWKKEFIIY